MSACQFVEKGVQEPAEISQAHLRVGMDLEAPVHPLIAWSYESGAQYQ